MNINNVLRRIFPPSSSSSSSSIPSLSSAASSLEEGSFWKTLRRIIPASTSASGSTVLGFKDVPGPRSLPGLGNALGYKAPGVGRDRKQSPRIWKHFHQTYGNLVRLDPPRLSRMPKMVIVMEPSMVEKVYRQSGPVPRRPGFQALSHARKRVMKEDSEYSDGLLTGQGESWKSLRSKVNQTLMKPTSAEVYQPQIDDICSQLVQRIQQVRCENHRVPTNFMDELYRFSLESIALIFFSRRLHCFKNIGNQIEELDLIRLVDRLIKGSKELDDSPGRLWEIFPWKIKQFEEDFTQFYNIVIKYIKEALDRIENPDRSKEALEMGILENLLLVNNGDLKSVTSVTLDMIFAGVDTTAHTTAFILYRLATNPQCQELLYQELAATPHKSIECRPYLRAVVKESMRMTPAAIGNIRQLDQPLTLDQYTLPGGTCYILAHHTMSNSEKYVTNPHVFSPERWIKVNGQKDAIHPFVVLPFGHGTRMCIGRRVAQMEIYSVVSHIIQNYQVEWSGDPLQIKSEILMAPDGPLTFRFLDR